MRASNCMSIFTQILITHEVSLVACIHYKLNNPLFFQENNLKFEG